jgi:hypothetical protein
MCESIKVYLNCGICPVLLLGAGGGVTLSWTGRPGSNGLGGRDRVARTPAPAFAELLLRIAPPLAPFRTVPAGQRVVEAIDKHASLCFLDSHHHPLPHKPQVCPGALPPGRPHAYGALRAPRWPTPRSI